MALGHNDILSDQITLKRHVDKLATTAKFNSGATSALDVEQSLSLLHTTEAGVAGLEISLQQLKRMYAWMMRL